jgi:hypothetical protein
LLGNVCLTVAESRFHVTNALLAIAQQVENGKAGGMHQGFVKFALLFVDFHEITYIQSFE